jgi:hypothetical protein
MSRSTFAILAALSLTSCSKLVARGDHDASSEPASRQGVTTATGTTASTPVHAGDDLLGLASGAMVVQRAKAPDANGEAWFMFDEDGQTGWTSDSGHHLEPTVVELAERSTIKSLQIDTARIETDGRLPKDVLFEVSDTSATTGFKPIATVTLAKEQKDGQTRRSPSRRPSLDDGCG